MEEEVMNDLENKSNGIIERKKSRWLDFKITNRCNNRCTYCGLSNAPPKSHDILSTEVVRRTLQEAIVCGFNHICLLGGEPTLRRDLVQILEPVSNESKIHLFMITNGLIYSETINKALFNIQCADVRVITSLDTLHFPNLRNINPKKVLLNISKVAQVAQNYHNSYKNRRIEMHMVISRENFRDIESFVLYFYNKGFEVTLAMVSPIEITSQPKKFNEFSEEDIKTIIYLLNRLESRGILNFINRTFLEFLMLYRQKIFNRPNICNAGGTAIINENGDVFPCLPYSFNHSNHCSSFGNIQKESFSAIYQRLKAFQCQIPAYTMRWDKRFWDCWCPFSWDRLATFHEEIESKNMQKGSKSKKASSIFNIRVD